MKRNKLLAVVLTFVFMLSMATSAYGAGTVYTTSLTADKVTIVNNYVDANKTTPGTITIKANSLVAGDVVTIKLGSTTVTSQAISNVTSDTSISVTSLTKKKGSVSITVSPTSTPTAISKAFTKAFDAQKSPVVTATAVAITGYADQDDILKVTDSTLAAGDVVTVYSAKAGNTPPASGAAGDEKALTKGAVKTAGSVEIKLAKINYTTSAGIKISITKKDCSESDKTLINNTSGATITEATKTTAVTTATAIAVPGGLLVTGLSSTDPKEKYTITAYKSDPSANLVKTLSKDNKTALDLILLGKATSVAGGKGSYVFIPFKNKTQLTDLASGAKIYVVNKYTGVTKDKGKAYSDVVEITVK